MSSKRLKKIEKRTCSHWHDELSTWPNYSMFFNFLIFSFPGIVEIVSCDWVLIYFIKKKKIKFVNLDKLYLQSLTDILIAKKLINW